MSKTISNSDDVIDSRDVIERIGELEDERQDLADVLESAQETLADAQDDTSTLSDDEEELEQLQAAVDSAESDLELWEVDNGEELRILQSLEQEAEYSPDWGHGETLIRDSYFTDYVQELLADTGDLPRELPWYIVIDWEATASNIQVDYSSVDFDGVVYWIRS